MNINSLNPADSFAVFPLPTLFLSLRRDVDPFAVLLAFVPVANVLSTIRPFEGAFSFFHVVHVEADVLPVIRPSEGSVALHLIVLPLTIEDSSIVPFVNAFPVDVVVEEFS